MAKIEQIENQYGRGYRITSEVIPLAGMIPVLLSNRVRDGKFCWQALGDAPSPWYTMNDESNVLLLNGISSAGSVSYIIKPVGVDDVEPLYDSVVYVQSMFETFFTSNDVEVLGWSINVLEKIFSTGILPIFISRKNAYDFAALFGSISQFFAYIVLYARQYRRIDSVEILLKKFLEGFGVVTATIDSFEDLQDAFVSWKNDFLNRGTLKIAEKSEKGINGELRRLVGYGEPMEFLFAPLQPKNLGWCVGWSSPTWTGTERVEAVGRRYGFEQYPSVGDVSVVTIDGKRAYQLGTVVGLNGICAVTKDDAFEVYSGLDYEVTVKIKVLTDGEQALSFGVVAFDEGGQKIFLGGSSASTDMSISSFMAGAQYQAPCLIAGQQYSLRGIVYGAYKDSVSGLVLNFMNGRPLLLNKQVKYLAPCIVQNRVAGGADVVVESVEIKPLNLFPEYQTYNITAGDVVPSISGTETVRYEWVNAAGVEHVTLLSSIGQGVLGNKHVEALYSELKNTSITKADIEDFIHRYLVGYKDYVHCAWLDFIE